MPRGKKRKDPEDAPIDGDYTHDVVVNKQKGFRYALLSAEDIPEYKQKGYVREDRGPDSAHPVYDAGAETGQADYTVKNLTLYKAPEHLASRSHTAAQRRADLRMSEIRELARDSGGEFTTQVVR